MNSGVYAITHIGSGKCYVGSSKTLRQRLKAHLYSLERENHHSKKLQHAWNKYGSKAFKFSVLLYCDVKNLLMYEQKIIDGFQSVKKGYNVCVKAGSREGTAHSNEVVSRMKEFQRSHRKKYNFNGEQLCIAEIAEKVGLPRSTLWRRVAVDGKPLEEAIATPYKKPGQPISGLGIALTFYEWVERIGCTQSFLRLWLQKNLTIEECIAKHKAITPHEFARVLGVDGNLFLSRLHKDWSVGDAIATPARKAMTTEDAKAIRELAKTMATKDIASMYGVHRDTIGLIIRNVSFKE